MDNALHADKDAPICCLPPSTIT